MSLPIVELIRIEESFDSGTFGVLRINKEAFCVTLELPDRLNRPNMSSIPAQQYICKKIISPKFGYCFEVLDVPGRSNILLHPGNTLDDTAGCILLAEHFGKLRGDRAILNSGRTYRNFLDKLADLDVDLNDIFHLTILEHF